ncbi:polyphosphate kinase 2, PA0141 family [Thiovulum sp. ES]|nr:polyphosphate kinase 2, PA0141 family [Thiovulum sp. ES]
MEANPEYIFHNGKRVKLIELLDKYESLQELEEKIFTKESKADRKLREIKELKPYQAELIKLQKHIEDNNMKMVILFEGRDAAGKGGTIRRVTRYMNEKHYRVVALGKPTDEERGQWYYQRYVKNLPRSGEIVLFDRSWYNRAMVEPVFGFCTEQQYHTFMNGVVNFEKDLINHQTIFIKLYFSVTKDEQKRRFDRRHTDILRQWKLSEIDLQAQDRWDDFTKMKYEMLRQTHTHENPWTIIRSDNKHLARMEAMKVILNSIHYKDRDLNVNYKLNPDIVVSGAREVELMNRQLEEEGRFTH